VRGLRLRAPTGNERKPPVSPDGEPKTRSFDVSAAETRLTDFRMRSAEAAGALSVVAACGLLVVTVAFALSRSGRPYAEPLFWAGLVTIVVPAAVRLTSSAPSRAERLTIIAVVGMALYLVKVVHDPFQFTFSDDLVHAYNADQIVRTGSLFQENPILSVTPHYPGLESVTAAFASMTGLSTFVAGAVIVGIGRLLVMLALFFFFEQVSGSHRVAGLGALFYTANPSFLFFDAQFSYESLALPLLAVVLFMVARWMRVTRSSHNLGGAALVGLVILAVVVTHHMTSYALAAFLLLVTAVQLALGGRRWSAPPLGFAAFTVASIVAWLVFVASDTVGYLSPVFTKAFEDTIHTISNESAPRALFASHEGTRQPAWDRSVGMASAAIIVVTLPLGLRALWRRYSRDAIALVLGAAGVAYVVALALRFVPGAWEVGSRASEFLFVGAAFVLALAVVERPPRELSRLVEPLALRLVGGRALPSVKAGAFGLAVAVVFAGGAIAGRPNELRLAGTLAVDVGGTTIEPQGSAAADWAREDLGPAHRFAAPASDGRLLLAYGRQLALTGKHPDIRAILRQARLAPWQLRVLRDNHIAYVLVDRRRVSDSPSRGYFFCLVRSQCEQFSRRSYEKFDREGASRLFDSGDVAVFDVRRLTR
jgi:hypothetical protein